MAIKPAETATKDISQLSFEQALKELEAIVRRLEEGKADLEGSIADYTRGVALKEHCQKKLAEARLKVEKIVKSAGGDIKTEDFNL